MRKYTGSTSCDDRATRGNSRGKIMVNLKENVRDPDEIKRLNDQCEQYNRPPHYDMEKARWNITYENCLATEEAFAYVFGDSLERFNSQQKRSDRKTSLEKEQRDVNNAKKELYNAEADLTNIIFETEEAREALQTVKEDKKAVEDDFGGSTRQIQLFIGAGRGVRGQGSRCG